MKDNFGNDLQNGIENYGRTGYETMANIDRLQKQVGFISFWLSQTNHIGVKLFNFHASENALKS